MRRLPGMRGGLRGVDAAALAGDVPGSSAGGEQPKFTATVDDGGTLRHVLVKFSPTLDTLVGRRWADLLVCEHLAAETAGQAAEPAARSSAPSANARSRVAGVREWPRCATAAWSPASRRTEVGAR